MLETQPVTSDFVVVAHMLQCQERFMDHTTSTIQTHTTHIICILQTRRIFAKNQLSIKNCIIFYPNWLKPCTVVAGTDVAAAAGTVAVAASSCTTSSSCPCSPSPL